MSGRGVMIEEDQKKKKKKRERSGNESVTYIYVHS